ncbi:MAG: HAD family hydrolase [Chlorobi bacterium]|nr:HAD family hydrolase [Chlorobiota bacterium]
MKISFELDQLLLTDSNEFPVEKQNHIQEVLRFEKLRLGAVELMQDIIGSQHEIWIYTASSRPKHYIYELFLRHGVPVSGIINRKKHVTTLNTEEKVLSKYPPAFNIDVHIDYSDNVKIDGEIFNFKTITVKSDEDNWAEVIQNELNL